MAGNRGLFLVVGAPVAHLQFVRNFTAESLATLHDEFQNLLSYPRPHDFLAILLQLGYHAPASTLGTNFLDCAHGLDVII